MNRYPNPIYPDYVLQVSMYCIEKMQTAHFRISEIGVWQLVIIFLLAIILSVSILLYYRYRKMKTRLFLERNITYLEARRLVEIEKQKAYQQADMLIEEKKATAVEQVREAMEKAKEEARLLQAQVTTTSAMLAYKTDYLIQLQEKLRTSDSNEYKRIAMEIKTNLIEADHWAVFIENFNLLHVQYIDNIIKKHPDLTSNEVRLICFILSGLSNKEISVIFSVETDSIKKARYRLKKKMNLGEADSLTWYLQNLRALNADS
ncbi:MAG TPA: hypothetical protein VIM79_18715 [Niastella sp.]